MATDHAASVQGVALRVCKLDIDSKPAAGSDTAFVTSAFTRVSFTPEYTEGEEIEEKAADGTACVYFETPSALKRVSLEIAICHPDPELYSILAGGTSLVDGPDIVGWKSPLAGEIANELGISVEVWSKAIVGGKLAAGLPYWHWVFPWVQLRMTGERVLENGAMANVFSGWGVGNAAWDPGPVLASDPTAWDYDTDAAFQYARAAEYPTITDGGSFITVPVAS